MRSLARRAFLRLDELDGRSPLSFVIRSRVTIGEVAKATLTSKAWPDFRFSEVTIPNQFGREYACAGDDPLPVPGATAAFDGCQLAPRHQRLKRTNRGDLARFVFPKRRCDHVETFEPAPPCAQTCCTLPYGKRGKCPLAAPFMARVWRNPAVAAAAFGRGLLAEAGVLAAPDIRPKLGYCGVKLISLAIVYRFSRNNLPTREPQR